MKIPINIGIIHFIGIGGIGMSGIAELLHKLGYKVQGSDQKESANTKRLAKFGIKIFIGHKAKNIDDAEVIVISSAIKTSNVEYAQAIIYDIPVVKRAEMLAELMRFKRTIAIGGTHGKTTTTSLIASLLAQGGYEPTVINGGIINEYASNTIYGAGEWMVVEADESDGSFLKLPSDIAVITNIDPEHLDYYGNFEKLQKAFRHFVENIPFYGFAVLCIDNENVKTLKADIHTRRIITYGASSKADVCYKITAQQTMGTYFDILIRKKSKLENFYIPMLGKHNVSNASAAIATALELDIDVSSIRKALENFGGVKRRFTHIASWRNIEIFDDYGHHPTEIRAVLKAAKETSKGKIIAIIQPHRYSRLNNLFNEFVDCVSDAEIVVVLPVYAAGEAPIAGANADELSQEIKKKHNIEAFVITNQEDLAQALIKLAARDDYIIFLGAGDITNWAYGIENKLQQAANDAR